MIWVVGASGMLGRELSKTLEENGFPFVGSDRDIDFRDSDLVEDFTKDKRVQWIVNCAAYTAVDKAEEEPNLARSLNVEGPAVLAAWAAAHTARLIHISTDYVFSGRGTIPYKEDDAIDPQNVYGRTKAQGEAIVRSTLPNHFILRTAWLYGEYGANFVATMLRLMSEKPEFGVVDDQWGAPTWARDLARFIVFLIGSESTDFGTYHVSGEGKITWFGFAQEILRLGRNHKLIEASPVIHALSTEQYPTKALRPTWSVLSKEKLKAVFGWTMPDWRDSLSEYMKEI